MDCPKCGLKHVESLGWCNSDSCYSSAQWSKEEIDILVKRKVEPMAFNRMKQETQMTRQEAIDKVAIIRGNAHIARKTIEVLEALGLIEFEDECDTRMLQVIGDVRANFNDEDFNRELQKRGYKIVKEQS